MSQSMMFLGISTVALKSYRFYIVSLFSSDYKGRDNLGLVFRWNLFKEIQFEIAKGPRV